MSVISPRKAVSFSSDFLVDTKSFCDSDTTDQSYRNSLSKLRNILNPRQIDIAKPTETFANAFEKSNLNLASQQEPKNVAKTLPSLLQIPREDSISSRESPSALSVLQKIARQNSGTGNVPSEGQQDLLDFIDKQSEQIEVLERERKNCNQEMNSLLNKVKDIIYENEELHQKQQNTIPARNGKFDLEVTSNDPKVIRDSKIAELEAQLLQYKRRLRLTQQESNVTSLDFSSTDRPHKISSTSNPKSCATCKSSSAQLELLIQEKNELLEKIDELENKLRKVCEREQDATRKLKASEHDKEKAKEEKAHAESEIARLKEEVDRQQQRIRDLIQENSRKLQDEKVEAEKKYRRELDHLNVQMSQDYEALTRAKLDLERQKRIEGDIKRELQLKTSLLEEMHLDTKSKIDHLQAELSHSLSLRSSLEQDFVKFRLQTEKADRDEKYESSRLRAELNVVRSRLAQTEEDLRQSKERLEGQLNLDGDISTLLHAMEDKQLKSITDLEQLIQSQNSMMDTLRDECKLLAEKLEETTQRNKLDIMDAVREGLQSGSPAHAPQQILDELTALAKAMSDWAQGSDATKNEETAEGNGNDYEAAKTSEILDSEESSDPKSEMLPKDTYTLVQEWQNQIQSLIARFSVSQQQQIKEADEPEGETETPAAIDIINTS